MKGTKKDKSSLKEKTLKRVQSMLVKLKDQPVEISKTSNTKLIDRDDTKAYDMRTVQPCRHFGDFNINKESVRGLPSQREKSETKPAETESSVPPFAQEDQQHVLNCMKPQYQYKWNEDINDLT